MEVTENKDYPDHVSFISTTDRSSHITYANQVFCDIAEYSQEELLGNPHKLVRHADMPKAAFGQLLELHPGRQKLDGYSEKQM